MFAAVVLSCAVLAGCASAPAGSEFNDPYEAQNRKVHAVNKAIDRTLFGSPDRRGLVPTLPAPVSRGLSNAASNMAAPSNMVNGILQGKPERVVTNLFRFLLNTTIGVGGIFDPATGLGVKKDDTDFGETLHVWGVGEGPYLEVPLLGPSTERDFAGTVVDAVMNPLNFTLQSPGSYYAAGIRVGARVGDRQRYADTVESILYESADSYAQSRVLYLQNRRFSLGEEEKTYDPYGDPFAQ